MQDTKRKRPPPPGAERRRHPRYEVLAQVEMSDNEATLVLPVRNISAGGIYVGLDKHSFAEISPGNRVSIFLDTGLEHGDEPLCVTLEARVVRVDNDENAGAALSWQLDNIEAALRARFEQVLGSLREHGVPDAA